MDSELFELDSMGVLRTTRLPAKLEWLNEAETEKALLIELFAAGEEGITRRRIAKLKEAGEDAAKRLVLRDLAHWERDRFGKLTFLVISWPGEVAAQTILKVSKYVGRGRAVQERKQESL